jgi:hypothetical protein
MSATTPPIPAGTRSEPGSAPAASLKGSEASAKAGGPTPEAGAEPAGVELKLYGETLVDKISSLLMAFVLAASFLVGWLGFWLMSTSAFDKKPSAPIELIEVSGNGGGSPDGVLGGKQDINVPGGEASTVASNNMEDASEFEEPNVELTSTGLIDTFVDASTADMANVDLAEAIPGAVAGQVATGRRSSKIGNGAPGLGSGGPGDGGYSRENRWTIAFPAGQTPDEYARQLDFFGVELAVKFTGTNMEYASKFSSGTPDRRVGAAKADMRLYFLWQGAGRKGHDLELLRRAGINVGNNDIFQFFPKSVEDQLIAAEVAFKGRQPAEIRRTVFTVVARGNGYAFQVVSQDTIR